MINTLSHLAYKLKVDEREINSIIENIDNFYYEQEKIKYKDDGEPKTKNGKVQKRVLNPSIKRLKEIQKRLQKNILQNLPIPDFAFGAIKGRHNISNAKTHQGKKYIFTTDLSNFFPSISHNRVFEMLISFKFSPTVARVITQLTTFKGRLPQGAPSSPMIANLVFVKTGNKLQKIANEHCLTFTSFVDDLTFSSPKDFKNMTAIILESIKEDGFKISHKKTNYKTKFPSVTGIIVKNNELDLTSEFKSKLNDTTSQSKAQVDGRKSYFEQVKKFKK
jgi:RNA-directed DNA polymerase